jgi:antitoxin (DNA-binding transcriptional repressor) of toxin-antitoxin stability system
MSHTVSVQQAGKQLVELVRALGPGDEIVLTQDNRPVAKIIPNQESRLRHPGNCKGMLSIGQEDKEHLVDFKEYMP